MKYVYVILIFLIFIFTFSCSEDSTTSAITNNINTTTNTNQTSNSTTSSDIYLQYPTLNSGENARCYFKLDGVQKVAYTTIYGIELDGSNYSVTCYQTDNPTYNVKLWVSNLLTGLHNTEDIGTGDHVQWSNHLFGEPGDTYNSNFFPSELYIYVDQSSGGIWKARFHAKLGYITYVKEITDGWIIAEIE